MELNTIEKFLLLAHHSRKGGFISSLNFIKLGFSGSVFLELAILDKISIKKRRIFLKNNKKPVGHFFLNEILEEVTQGNKPMVLKSRIISLYGKRISNMWVFLEGMAEKGLLRIEDKRFLWVIPYRKSYLINSSAQELLISEYKSKLTLQKYLNGQDRAIIGLIDICKLHPNLSSKKSERKEFEKLTKEVLQKMPIQDSVDDAIHQTLKIIVATMYLTVYYGAYSSSSR